MDPLLQARLPAFFVVGAQKAGTTSLHAWLSLNPAVRLPPGKETHFFSDDEKFARGIGWYLDQFGDPRAGTLAGEVAPQYMYSREAPERMRRWMEAPRLIFLLRHPLDRAHSNYLMTVREGKEALSFHDALLEEPARIAQGAPARDRYGYMARGRYGGQIRRFQRHFPAAPMLFVLFDDLVDAGVTGRATLTRIAHFIGVSPVRPGAMTRENAASRPRFQALRDLVYGQSAIKRLGRLLIPSRDLRERLMASIDRVNRVPIAPRMGPVPARAIDETMREIEELEATLGLDLERWKRRTADIARGAAAAGPP